MRKFTFKNVVLSCLLAFGYGVSAQVIYNEPFTSSLNTATATNGSNGNWVFTNSCAKSGFVGHTGPGSALFQGSGCQFGNGGSIVSGNLTTPTIATGPFGAILSFNYYLENECGSSNSTCGYDVLTVLMSNNNGASYSTLMSSNTGTFTNGNVWKAVTMNLAANQTITVRFNFNSVDGISNTYDGVYIDDINVESIPACSASPVTTTMVPTTTLVCPVFGTASFTPSTTYTLGGINYAWYQSTGGAIGPYTAVNGATLQTYTTPTLNTTTWYQMVATCIMGGVATTMTPVEIQVAATTTNTVPYFEGFEGITQNKQLPNCSWFRNDNFQAGSRTAMVSAWRQARTGNKFAEFDASNSVYYQTRYFWSNGIQMNAGITYSASVWYNTPGYATWYNLALMYGPNQSPTGLIPLATIAYPNNSTYQVLTNTFNVATTGMYYMAVTATEYGYGSQMVWDDLLVIAPCQFTNNAASIALSGTTTICAGQTVNINASGASTYSWSTGGNTSAISVAPMFNTTYSVIGTNPNSGCTGTALREIVVNQLPPIAIVPLKQTVCEGESVTMQAFSGVTYTWNEGPTYSSILTVTPTTTNNSFTVSASDVYGCVGTAVQQINVNPVPVITVTGANNVICKGTSANLTASGAGANGSYEWMSNSVYLQSNPASVSPNTTTTYSVVGTSVDHCEGTALVTVSVSECVGINAIQGSSAKVAVYPNPNNGVFAVSLENGLSKTIEVIDITGRLVLTSTSAKDVTEINISALANGIYYLKIKSENVSEVVKVVKQ